MANCNISCSSNDPKKILISINGRSFDGQDLMEAVETAEQTFMEFEKGLVGGIYSATDGGYREMKIVAKKGSCLDLFLKGIDKGSCIDIAVTDFNEGSEETIMSPTARLMSIGARKIASSEGIEYILHGDFLTI